VTFSTVGHVYKLLYMPLISVGSIYDIFCVLFPYLGNIFMHVHLCTCTCFFLYKGVYVHTLLLYKISIFTCMLSKEREYTLGKNWKN
jgi:hypothetical protein